MSDFLFARPSIVEGIGRNLDLFGTMQVYNSSDTPEEADRRAMQADIAALRADMRASVSSVLGSRHGKKNSR